MTFFAFTKDMSDTGGLNVVPGSPDSFQFNGRITGYRNNGSAMRVMGPQDPLEGVADVASYSGIFHSAGYDVTGTLKTRFIIGANVEMDMELQAPHQLRIVGNDNTQTDGQVWVASHTNVVISPRGVDSVNCRRLIIDRVDKVNFDDLNTSDVEISVNQGNIRFASIPVLPQYTVGALPTGVAGGMIYVTDAAPNPAMCFFNGTSWIDVVTGVAVV
jgi:hypothetical protein